MANVSTAPLACIECGTALPEWSRSHARYCSSTCRSRASRAQAGGPAEPAKQPTTSAEYLALLARPGAERERRQRLQQARKARAIASPITESSAAPASA